MTQDRRWSTDFPLELARRLAGERWGAQHDFLYYHQNIARVYFGDPQTRGLLIYHGTGMGKSILAASLAMDAIYPPEADRANARRVIVLLAKSLAHNMQDSIAQYIRARVARGGVDALGEFGALAALPEDKRDEWIRRTFSFVTMNASNMISQMNRASAFMGADEEDAIFDMKAADLSASARGLDGKMLIVDEAHNFFRAITNGSRNAAVLYDQIMAARDMKIAFLTGTPIASHPFEMSVCFNMLAGTRVLPQHFDDFARLFIARGGDTPIIANRERFQNRIFGLVSYVDYASTPGAGAADILAGMDGAATAHAIAAPAMARVEFPEEYPIKLVRVPMTEEQYGAYIIAREQEKSEGLAKAMRGADKRRDGAGKRRDGGARVKVVMKAPQRMRARETPALQKPKSDFSSSYRVHSRQISNYCPPASVRERLLEARAESPAQSRGVADTIPASALLDEIGTVVSAKFSALAENLRAHRGQLGLIYSQFVGIGGLAALARFLEQNGWRDNFAIISGDVDIEERARVVARFSDANNMRAETLALLLVSSTGAEGLDLKNVRHVHILEPYWNFGRIKQVKARAIRNGSHADLPPAERNVATYIYIAIAPVVASKSEAAPERESAAAPERESAATPRARAMTMFRAPAQVMTSDEELYAMARESQILIDSFESAIREVSIECAINHRDDVRARHCRICAPSAAKLYTDSIEADMNAPDPCTPIASTRVVAKKIKVGAETYSYRVAPPGSMAARVYGYDVYALDERLRAWRKLPINDARYIAIVAAIRDAEA